MALILCIETATDVCSVALYQEEILCGIRESSERNVHSARLTEFINELITSSEFMFSDLDAIAVSMGPGSYTGLRIGVATAKGLCYALDKPLIAVPTLQAMAAGIN
jgi:tRNA threonylcarbamoyladenosine biosynthesis protein TsaB